MLKHILMCLVAIALGGGTAIQTGINKTLSEIIGAVVAGVCVSFFLGSLTTLFFSLIMMMKHQSTKLFCPRKPEDTKFRLWELCGGFIGALVLTTNVFVSPILGFTLYGVMTVSGQLLSSLVIDHTGFMMPVRKATVARVVFTLITLIGCVTTNLGSVIDASGNGTGEDPSDGQQEVGDSGKISIAVKIALSLSGLTGGCLIPVQTAINRRLSSRFLPHVRSIVSFISFSTGTIFLMVVVVIFYNAPMPAEWAPKKAFSDGFEAMANSEWWRFLGGPIGGVFVTAAIFFAPIIGVSTFFVCIISGFLLCSFIIDIMGAFGVMVADVTASRVIGVCVTLIGAAGVAEEARVSKWISLLRKNVSLRESEAWGQLEEHDNEKL